ncbi:collagen alpha-1(I) chain-like isoform X1 [Diceros bicornis minor]|uniref:collagen alpha-1(I) chain-like isoform X1 n=1 Tax=Diceros bicornis minor TaxID=77932 RepID=UPI0026EC5C2E|nr:collagen alpha-1(I) chain-like isoform X1 [Diceros bicornis minor]
MAGAEPSANLSSPLPLALGSVWGVVPVPQTRSLRRTAAVCGRSPVGLEMLCWQEIRKCSSLMGQLPAPSLQFWELGLLGPRFAGTGQLQSPKPGRDPPAPTRESPTSGVLPTHPEPGSRPEASKGVRGGPGFLGEQRKPPLSWPPPSGAPGLPPHRSSQPEAYLAGGLGRGCPALSGLGGGRGQGCPDPLFAGVCVRVCARL